MHENLEEYNEAVKSNKHKLHIAYWMPFSTHYSFSRNALAPSLRPLAVFYDVRVVDARYKIESQRRVQNNEEPHVFPSDASDGQ